MLERGGQWFVEGVFSWTNNNCGTNGLLPLVATKISSFLDWIEKKKNL